MTKFGKRAVSSFLSSNLNIKFEDKECTLGGWGQSDNFIEIEDILIFLEVENKQKHPSTNVLKYWPYLESQSNKKIVLVHAFSTESPGLNSSRGRLAEWAAQKMQQEFGERFKYFRIIFHTKGKSIDGINKLSSYIQHIRKK